MFFLQRMISHYKNLLNGFNSIVTLNGLTKEEFQAELKNGNHKFWMATFLSSFVILEAFYSIKDFASNFGFSNLGIDKFAQVNFDNPSAYKFQNQIQDLDLAIKKIIDLFILKSPFF